MNGQIKGIRGGRKEINMIEVLKHGNDKKEIECKNCGALLRYDRQEDVKIRDLINENGRSVGQMFYITCPDCKRAVKIETVRW
jgi:uncharacterized Zn finger protein